jgi:hypothetical protein
VPVRGHSLLVSLRTSSRIDRQETKHTKDLSFQKEMAFWEPKNRFLVEWSAIPEVTISLGLTSG